MSKPKTVTTKIDESHIHHNTPKKELKETKIAAPNTDAAAPNTGAIKNEKSDKNRIDYQSFIGVDLHKCTVTFAAVNPSGQKIGMLKISTKCIDKMAKFITDAPGPVHLAVEAVGFVEWFIDRFRPVVESTGGKIEIAHATALERMRGKRRKTDRNDALDIAKRLARGECPLGWIASEQVSQLRKMGRHWKTLSKTMCRAKHGMKSMLNAANITGPKMEAASIQKWLLAHGHLLKPVQQQAFSDLLDIVSLMERHRARLQRQIIMANRDPLFIEGTQRLQSVPGIANIWACIIMAEIGDFSRFPNADTIEFWAGYTPDEKESAGRTQSGAITKAGSGTLRWALGKAAMCMCRSDSGQEEIRKRLVRRLGKPKANVAMGRRLLGIIYAMFRDGSEYRFIGKPTNHNLAANKARMRKRNTKINNDTNRRKAA